MKLFDGMKELLDELVQKGIKVYVWTARNRASTVQILKSAGVIHYFEELSTCTDCENKPSPAGLIAMLGDTPKHEILVIGDSFADMLGAKNYQVASIGANWQQKNADTADVLLHFGAREVFNSIGQLRNFLIK